MYGFTLIFILAFIGGVIAYIGDKIGMKIGRKRLTLFGLRPKYTGIVITIFTGIFISLASIVILTIASDDVRTALFEMKEIQATLANNQQQLELSMAAMTEMESNLDRLVAERDLAVTELADTQSQLEQARQQYEELALKRDELTANVADLEERIAELVIDYVRFANFMRTGNVVFRADEIIYAQVVEASHDINEIYLQLESVLNKADQKAYALGAKASDHSQSAIMASQEQIDVVAYMILQGQGLFVVRVLSEENTVVGESVPVTLQIIPNDIIFQEGAVLEEITLDLNQTVEVDKQILNLLEQANAVAVIRGMITSDNGGAVVVDGNEFFKAMDTVRELAKAENRPDKIKIQAKAMEDTFAVTGPVKIRLEIVNE